MDRQDTIDLLTARKNEAWRAMQKTRWDKAAIYERIYALNHHKLCLIGAPGHTVVRKKYRGL